MTKTYNVFLDGQKIGTTQLEKADAPMGVVFGLIEFKAIQSPYRLFKYYCAKNKIAINLDDPKFEFIDTQVIPELKVLRQDGLEINGEAGNAVCGMKEEGYEITILGIGYPFFEEEFPHHTEAYKNQFE